MLQSRLSNVDHISKIFVVNIRFIYVRIYISNVCLNTVAKETYNTPSTPALPKSDPSSSHPYLFLVNMGNSNDKKKTKKPAKRQPAAAPKADGPATGKRTRKLTSKAATRKNHLQDDSDSNPESSDNGAEDKNEEIESVFCSL
jgi:hypothetical protein